MAKRPSPDLKKLTKSAIRLTPSGMSMSRVLEILAERDGDVSAVVNRLRGIDNDELRRGFAAVARLLAALEKQAAPAEEDASPTSLPSTREVFPTDEPTCAPGRVIDRVKMFTDGASRGNPGPAAIGIVFTDMEGSTLWQACRRLDEDATNNVAEYEALREGLARALSQGWKKVHVFSDSELLVRQMTGRYKIKNPVLQKRAAVVRSLIRRLDAFTIVHIGREQNRLADRLAAHALKNADE
jgi:ribonuclease HI